jgi:hypothetical protein
MFYSFVMTSFFSKHSFFKIKSLFLLGLLLGFLCFFAVFPLKAQTAKQTPAQTPAQNPSKVTRAAVAEAFKNVPQTHPRLFGDAADFERLRKQSLTPNPTGVDALVVAAAGRIIHSADALLKTQPLDRKLAGRRLLGVSRTALNRISTLAMAYRLTKKTAYLEHAAAEMRSLSAFSDWNPSHFLDVAEMTLALAIGYDWLYNELDPDTRATVANAIRKKGLAHKSGWWITATNNWGQVCHGGLLAGALALHETDLPLAIDVAHRAITRLPISMRAFAPKGCYPEGPGYWSYGTDFNVIAIGLLEKNLRSDFGLASLAGFAKTAEYLDLMTGPSGKTFNYADGGSERDTDFASWWLAKRFNRPDTLPYFELPAFLRYCANRTKGGSGYRLFALTLFSLQDVPAKLAPRAPLAWASSGKDTAVTVQRTSWDNARTTFVGLKAGTATANHGHMDAGSFVFDADGVRWAVDIGPEPYGKIEALKMNLWYSGQESDRWKIFRLNNFSHNTLTIDNKHHFAKGFAKIISLKDLKSGVSSEVSAGVLSEVTLDLTPVFPASKQVIRKGVLLKTGEYRLTDTLKVRPGARVRWAMMTRATPDAPAASNSTDLLLRQSGKTLRLRALHTPAPQWRTSPANPQQSWDSPNKGITLLSFEAVAPASGELTFDVLFSPGSVSGIAP